MKLLFFTLVFLALNGPTLLAAESLLIDDFEAGLGPHWEEKVFTGRTDYRVVQVEEGMALRAESRDAASGLVMKKSFDPKVYPTLKWRWRVDNILSRGDARTKSGDDYAARVYVVFPHWFFPKTRTINYIWANRLPKGEALPNPFTGNAMMLAVESGSEKLGTWVAEERNIYEDFQALFGEEPPMAGAIAVMTDTDNTHGWAVAYYDDLRLESR